MIFLSYSPNDLDSLLPLVEALKDNGVDVWFDRDKTEWGHSLVRKISEGIDESDRLLVAWSSNASNSDHVQNEIDAFYGRRPQAPFTLFMRLDNTRIPTLYASRRYLQLTDDIEGAVQVIANWVKGQQDEHIQDTEAAAPSPQFLNRFPRGPRVPFQLIMDELVLAYAEALDSLTQARRIVNKANQMREEADPGDSKVTTLKYGFLPSFEAVGAYAFWQEVFHAACLNGPRMLGALLLAQPDDLFDTKARSARAKLLQHLHAMNQSRDEGLEGELL
jgi:hypothetical protein